MLGIDIVDINKFQKKIRNNSPFLKIFTNYELEYARSKDFTKTLAGIYAAKEAFIKAFNGKLSDIKTKKITIQHKNNKPYILYNNIKYDVSISHDGNYAIAICNLKFLIDIDNEMMRLKPRKQDSHKGDYGKILLIGGSSSMSGAIFLTTQASLRSGAGLVYVKCPKSISRILQIKTTEAIIQAVDCDNFSSDQKVIEQITKSIDEVDIIAIGPGMGKAHNINLLLKEIFLKAKDKAIVLDADALNSISRNIDILKLHRNLILTPHPKEFERLSGLNISYIQKNREKVAKEFAKKYHVTLVLKGHNSVVTDGKKLYVNKSGTAAMATAGSGDVLVGIISSFLKRYDTFEAVKLAVYAHGKAGELAELKLDEDSVIASDIIDNLAYVLKAMKGAYDE
ncbi:MAG: NAD(P)H-hydrate dehydratase [Tissierellia bacterium]|nr:NAD(P)H-hydrate dehydratase [Tissierellia bacterium]